MVPVVSLKIFTSRSFFQIFMSVRLEGVDLILEVIDLILEARGRQN